MKSGELLRKSRHEKGLSIGQVASDLYIQEKYIQALEESNYEIIPGETYQRAYFRKYAEYLGLTELFERAVKSENCEDVDEEDDMDDIFGGTWDSARMTRVIVKLVLVVFIIVMFSLVLKNCFSKPGELEPDPRINSTVRTIESVPTESAAPSWERPRTFEDTTGGPDVEDRTAYELKLTATGECWVTVITRDGVIFQGSMLAGDYKSWKDFQGFHVSAGKPEQLLVEFNNESIEWATGQMALDLPDGFTLDKNEPRPETNDQPSEQDNTEPTETPDTGTE